MAYKFEYENIDVTDNESGQDVLKGSILCYKGDKVYRLKFNRPQNISPERVEKYVSQYADEFGTDNLDTILKKLQQSGRTNEITRLCTRLFGVNPENQVIEQFFATDNGSLDEVTPRRTSEQLPEITGIWYDPSEKLKEFSVSYIGPKGEELSKYHKLDKRYTNQDFIEKTGGKYGIATWRKHFFELQRIDRRKAYDEFEKVFGFEPV